MSDTTNYFAAIDAHIESITPAHRAAFADETPVEAKPGDVVWMLDHYNTARIVSPSVDGHWVIETTFADGEVWRSIYEACDLRPAAAPVEFRWPAPAASRHPLLEQYDALIASSVPPTASQWRDLARDLGAAATRSIGLAMAVQLDDASEDCERRADSARQTGPE